jgi:hypothetical protein
MAWILCILFFTWLFWLLISIDYDYHKEQNERINREKEQIKRYQDLYKSWSK